MSAPIRQICVEPSTGVGFVIEYRETQDAAIRRWGDAFFRSPVEPSGDGWDIVRRQPHGYTLWRRFIPWVGKRSPWRQS